MKRGTNDIAERFETGKRIKECRKLRGLSVEQLCERIESLPDNHGKRRSEKQIRYLESGARSLSFEYATLIAQALQVRAEYLLLEDNYVTGHDVLCAGLDKMEEHAKILHALIRLVAKNQGFDVEMIDLERGELSLPADMMEVEPIYYVFKAGGKIIAHLSLDDYTKLRDEIYHYSYYLVEGYRKRQEKLLMKPYEMVKKQKDGGKNG